MVIKRGKVFRLGHLDMTVVVLKRAGDSGWDCLCLGGEVFYKYQDIFVFTDDLREAQEVDIV